MAENTTLGKGPLLSYFLKEHYKAILPLLCVLLLILGILVHRLSPNVFPTYSPHHTVLLTSDNDVLAVNLFLNDSKMLLECIFTEEVHVVAGLTIVGVLKVIILCLRKENMMSGDHKACQHP